MKNCKITINEERYLNFLDEINTSEDFETFDWFGSYFIGNLCFDLVIRNYSEYERLLVLDCYVLGVDTGEAYTPIKETPYAYYGDIELYTEDTKKCKTYEDFISYLSHLIEKFVAKNPNLSDDYKADLGDWN